MAAVLRRAVLDHVQSEPRRDFPPLLHLGLPGRGEEVVPADLDASHDQALRADIVATLLHRTRRTGFVPLVWLTRSGPLEVQDVDAFWLAAARAAAAEAGVELTLVVVTRRGWFDPRSGARREWKRLRAR
jgi:hypothetical protein